MSTPIHSVIATATEVHPLHSWTSDGEVGITSMKRVQDSVNGKWKQVKEGNLLVVWTSTMEVGRFLPDGEKCARRKSFLKKNITLNQGTNIKDLGGMKARWSTETTPPIEWRFQHLAMNQAQISVDLRQ
jgi:hypothetical protein